MIGIRKGECIFRSPVGSRTEGEVPPEYPGESARVKWYIHSKNLSWLYEEVTIEIL